MNIREMQYDFKVKADKIDSLKTRNLLPAEIDWILNNAIQEFVDNKYGDFESKQDLVDQLSTLVVKSPTDIQSVHIATFFQFLRVYPSTLPHAGVGVPFPPTPALL